jgi:hypothetical protein
MGKLIYFFQPLEEPDKIVDDFIVHHVFNITAFFFGEDDGRLR